jgi:LacI family transcriptional regulator, repressor for deo operon, udp, cdd, tsx, nupC, and nupG
MSPIPFADRFDLLEKGAHMAQTDMTRRNHPDMNRTFPKIRDVAVAAGVSTATVSRALSRPDRVSEQTRAMVMQAIAETGYMVNHAARNLRRQQTGGIVVLVPNLANPFFSQILSGIAAAMSPAGYNVLIADTQQAPHGDALIVEYIHNNRADGLIVLDANLPDDLLAPGRFTPRHPPLVFACEWRGSDERPRVTIDNAEGARLAIRHLAALGHRKIGHLTGPGGNVLTATRLDGTRMALAEAGLPVRDEWFFGGDFSLASGAAAARRWMALSDRPSAVFCASDAMACGFMGALHRSGVNVPRDVSVVGFDDIEIAGHVIPALTTVRQPRAMIGETAARMLLDLLQGGDDRPSTGIHTVVPVEMVVRDSTAAPAM